MKKQLIVLVTALSVASFAHAWRLGFTSDFRDTIKIDSPPGLKFLEADLESGNDRIAAIIDNPTSMRIKEEARKSWDGAKFKIKIGYDANRYCMIHISDSARISKISETIDVHPFSKSECHDLNLNYNGKSHSGGAFHLKFVDNTPAQIIKDKDTKSTPA